MRESDQNPTPVGLARPLRFRIRHRMDVEV